MAATPPSGRQEGRDRRRWSRYRLDGPPLAVLVSGSERLACLIEDVSLSGARLRLASPTRPSDDLRLDYNGKAGPSGRCAWIDGDSIGLNFGFSDEALALTLACIGGRRPAAAKAEPTGADATGPRPGGDARTG